MSQAPETIELQGHKFELFLPKSEIKKAIHSMADQINHDYQGKVLVIIGVLDGVFMVLAQLMKRLNMNVSMELVKLKSYDGFHSSGKVNMIFGLTSSLKGADVLVVEDIVDSGFTLTHLINELKKENPASIEIATLLLKKDAFKAPFPVKYVGLEIPNRFVIGFGMDYNGEGRQLPDIYARKLETGTN